MLDPNLLLQLIMRKRAQEEANARQQNQQATEEQRYGAARDQQELQLGLTLAKDPNFDVTKFPVRSAQTRALLDEFQAAHRKAAKAAEAATGPGAFAAANPIGGGAEQANPNLAEVLDSLRSVQSQAGPDLTTQNQALQNVTGLAQAGALKNRQAQAASDLIAGRIQARPENASVAARASEGLGLRREALDFRKKQVLTTQWNALSKDRLTLQVASDSVDELAKLKSAQADVEILYSLAKADDPRVSDRDFQLRARAGSYGDIGRTVLNQALVGPLPNDIRQRLIAVTKAKLAARLKTYEPQRKAFVSKVRKEGFNPDEIMVQTAGEGPAIPPGFTDLGEIP